jgi:hypothetical protein
LGQERRLNLLTLGLLYPHIADGIAAAPRTGGLANYGLEQMQRGSQENSDLLDDLFDAGSSSEVNWDLEQRLASTEMIAETLWATSFFRERRGPHARSSHSINHLVKSLGKVLEELPEQAVKELVAGVTEDPSDLSAAVYQNECRRYRYRLLK